MIAMNVQCQECHDGCAAQGGNTGPNVGSSDNQRRTPNLARDLLSELADFPNPFAGNPANEAATKVHLTADGHDLRLVLS